MGRSPARIRPCADRLRRIVLRLAAGSILAAGCTGGKGTTDASGPPRVTPGGGPDPAPEADFALSLPFADAGEFKYIHPGYSADAQSGSPWGFKHEGLDLIAEAGGARVLAPADGEVREVVEYHNPVNGQWQVNLHIRCDGRHSYNLLFEPRAHTAEGVALQRGAIRVDADDRVAAGDTLGAILNLSSEETGHGDVTVHFDLWVDGRNTCPEPYFTPQALAAMLSLLRAKYPDGQLCYPSPQPSGVGL